MQLKKGMVIVTQGNPYRIFSNLIKYCTGSWWTHCFLVISETESLEAWVPRARVITTEERLNQLKKEDRDFVIMDLPDISDEERELVVTESKSFIGVWYNIWNAIFFFFFRTWAEKGNRVFCSQLIAKAYKNAIDKNIFSNLDENLPMALEDRYSNLHDGYCTPVELFRYSDFKEVYRYKA
jgi:hypothetical protein